MGVMMTLSQSYSLSFLCDRPFIHGFFDAFYYTCSYHDAISHGTRSHPALAIPTVGYTIPAAAFHRFTVIEYVDLLFLGDC